MKSKKDNIHIIKNLPKSIVYDTKSELSCNLWILGDNDVRS